MALTGVKALTFDVFGTVVDWRSSIIREGEAFGKPRGLSVDWAAFADRWRALYQPAMEEVRSGKRGWTKLDDLHRESLGKVVTEFGIKGVMAGELDDLNRAWHRLDPWPDSVPGLTRLKRKYILATLSNGNVALLVNMAKRSGLPWDTILGSELVQHYKPDREVYVSAAYYLDLKPEEVMMVAAHVTDLKAARSCGLRTGFIYRPNEFGTGSAGVPDKAQPGDYDVVSTSAVDLAQQLGA